MPDAELPPVAERFRLGFVPGVTPAKWVRVWKERMKLRLELVPLDVLDAGAALLSGEAHGALLRLGAGGQPGEGLSAIGIYDERAVVMVGVDDSISAVDVVTLADLADEIVLHPMDDLLAWDRLPGKPARERPATTADAVALVAAGIGVLIVPMSLARLHHRKDVVYREVSDAPVSPIAFAWAEDAKTELVEEFIGIIRGRTANSSRGLAAADAAESGDVSTAGAKTKGAAGPKSAAHTKAEEARRTKAQADRREIDRRAAGARKAAAKAPKGAKGRPPAKKRKR